MDGHQGHRRRRRQHLYPGAGRRLRSTCGPPPHRRARPARHGPRPARRRRRPRAAHARPARLDRPPAADRRSGCGPRRRRLRAVPAAGRWPGRAARRRDAPPPIRGHRPGDDGRGWLRQGDAHGPGHPRARRARRPPLGARRVDRRLHEPGRHRHPGPHRWRAPGDRVVQRRDQPAAPDGHALRRRARTGRAGACRAQPPDLGACGPRRWRRPAARAARRARRAVRR